MGTREQYDEDCSVAGNNEQGGANDIILVHQKSSGKASHLVRLFAAPYPSRSLFPDSYFGDRWLFLEDLRISVSKKKGKEKEKRSSL